MINIILCLFFVCTLGIILLMIVESQMEKLPPNNKFKIWWKNNIIGDDIYGDDF